MNALKINYCIIILFFFTADSAFSQDERVKLYLFTPSNQNSSILLTNATLASINTSLETKIIIHGFFEHANRYWMRNIKDAYFKRGNYNVILVDWSYWSIWRIFSAINNISNVGLVVANTILELAFKHGLNLNHVHILGFSLGAHAAGYAGQYVFAATQNKVGRITSLDGVGQTFENLSDNERLSSDDANFVDVVHTSWVGRYDPYGTVDYYVNGRFFQKGCPDIFVNGWKTTLIDIGINLVTCSHERAHEYFIESINCEGIVGKLCDTETNFNNGICDTNSEIIFGEDVTSTSGSFFIKTPSKFPFNTKSC